ncbi:MAG: hypothetical protein ACO25L_07155 [Candidatus Nanopelagicales bacterium]
MEEQQQHLLNLNQQRTELGLQINQLQAQISEKKDLFLKITGAIEYLDQIGVKLPVNNKEDVQSQSTSEEKS